VSRAQREISRGERLRHPGLVPPLVSLVLLLVLLLLLVSCGGAAATTSTAATSGSTTSSGAPSTATTATAQTTAAPQTTASTGHNDLTADLFSPAQEVLDTVYTSVVNIAVTATVQGQTGQGVGSGVVYTSDGLILTNDHVVTLDGNVQTGQKIVVTFSDGTTTPATLVATNADKDVAAIRVQKTGLVPVTFGVSKDVLLGEWAIVIGSPLDFRNTVTLGIVSGLDRSLSTGAGTPPLTGLMQIDTPISPGNSGGGCFDTQGRFIGMPEVYLPPAQTGAENIGFAIPADVVAATAKTLTGK
jgi:S1-C subfamily serine protease